MLPLWIRFRGQTLGQILGLLLGLALLAPAAPAWAELEICNGTEEQHALAIGYKQGDSWVSEGWWPLQPGACATPLTGDLTQRYYYFRATRAGREFAHENYMFCTDPKVFTISGDSDCAARGYERSGFRRIDTGARATSYRYVFDAAVSPPTATPKPSRPAPVAEAVAGEWGEPYASATAIFQDCVTETEAPFCTFHADGTKFFVYQDGRTPDHIFAALADHWPGTPIEVEGDLTALYDRTAELVLRRAVPRAWTRWDGLLDRLQGGWYNTADAHEQFTILGSELIYDDGLVEYLSLTSHCDGLNGTEILRRVEEESGEVFCYGINALEQFRLELIYLPRGNLLDYRKLD